MQLIMNVTFSIIPIQEIIIVFKCPDYFVLVRTKMFDTLNIST